MTLKRTRSIQKGTTPIHAEPSKVSGTRPGGSSAPMADAGTGQCAKSRSFQRWVMAQCRRGSGVGRCPVVLRMSCTGWLRLKSSEVFEAWQFKCGEHAGQGAPYWPGVVGSSVREDPEAGGRPLRGSARAGCGCDA